MYSVPGHTVSLCRLSDVCDEHLHHVSCKLVHFGELGDQGLTFVLLAVGAEEREEVVDLMLLPYRLSDGGTRLVHLHGTE